MLEATPVEIKQLLRPAVLNNLDNSTQCKDFIDFLVVINLPDVLHNSKSSLSRSKKKKKVLIFGGETTFMDLRLIFLKAPSEKTLFLKTCRIQTVERENLLRINLLKISPQKIWHKLFEFISWERFKKI